MTEKMEENSRKVRGRDSPIAANGNESQAPNGVVEPKPELITIKAFCRLCSIGRTSAYKILGTQKVRAARLGGRTLVVRADVDALIAQSIVDWTK